MPLGQSEAAALGLPALPFAVIGHPLAGLGEAEVLARAETIAGEVVHILTTVPEQLAAEYLHRRYIQPAQVFPAAGQREAACSDPLSCGDV